MCKSFCEPQDRSLSVRENIMHLLNILLILKTAMMTRMLVFRSVSFKEARGKIFTGNYLFMSHEMNILSF